jgi:hypothetical protein
MGCNTRGMTLDALIAGDEQHVSFSVSPLYRMPALKSNAYEGSHQQRRDP